MINNNNSTNYSNNVCNIQVRVNIISRNNKIILRINNIILILKKKKTRSKVYKV